MTEIHKADPQERRRALRMMALGVAIGVPVIYFFERYFPLLADRIAPQRQGRARARIPRTFPQASVPPHGHWLETRLGEIPGIEIDGQRSHDVEIDRWLETEAGLEAGPAPDAMQTVRISGAVPYTTPTPAGGVSGPLVYLPPEQAISSADVRNKIVLREVTYGSIPNAAFGALEWWSYDPDLVLTATVADSYERDWVDNVQGRIDDMLAAGEAGAAGVILIHDFPSEQVQDHYMPYVGEVWPVPALYVGVDEGEALKQLAADGGHAQLTLLADRGPATTRHLVATLAGAGEERIVITSHTDGVHALWDNGPLVMLEMARYFARFSQECRPKTLEFGFTTAHLHHRNSEKASADEYGRNLDFDYEDGTVAMALVLEHLGALNYAAQPRGGGKPGREFVLTGNPEPISWLINEPLLADLALQATVEHDMRQSLALRGADAPGARIPVHRSMGGEGGAYNNHLIPTAAYITAPWTLFNPNFGPEELMDKQLLHRQALMFTDYLHLVSPLSRELLAGSMNAQRAAREVLCASPIPPGAVVECEGTPAESGASGGE